MRSLDALTFAMWELINKTSEMMLNDTRERSWTKRVKACLLSWGHCFVGMSWKWGMINLQHSTQ